MLLNQKPCKHEKELKTGKKKKEKKLFNFDRMFTKILLMSNFDNSEKQIVFILKIIELFFRVIFLYKIFELFFDGNCWNAMNSVFDTMNYLVQGLLILLVSWGLEVTCPSDGSRATS